jgi:hypothetical protein
LQQRRGTAGQPGGSFACTLGNVEIDADSDTDLHRVRTWAEHRNPPEAREQIWIELDITSAAVTIYECRPPWHGEENEAPMREAVARCRWNDTTKRWTLYWQRRDLKFHLWPQLDPQPTITPLLAEIDDDSNGAFWG